MSKTNLPIILSVDTSCDETSAAVTKGLTVLSNIVWSQSNIHSKFGGVVPNTAKREHERKIGWVVEKAVKTADITYKNVDAFAVTVGPGLAIALGVGINFVKQLAIKYQKPLIAINHLEGHLLSPLANTDINQVVHLFPAFGAVVSGGNTQIIFMEKIGKYKIIAQTIDDALGESLDKSARLLGFGYPGGATLEKFARLGDPKKFILPIPMLGREKELSFSYSGLKTSFLRLYNKLQTENLLGKQTMYDLAASYQNSAFEHFTRVLRYVLSKQKTKDVKYIFVGGGVSANVQLRKGIRLLSKEFAVTPLFPYSKKLQGDNAVMIGISAYFKYSKKEFSIAQKIDRLPNLKIDAVV